MVEKWLCSWYQSACFFLIKASGQNIELRVKLSCSLWNVNEDFPFKGFQSTEYQVVMYELFIGCIWTHALDRQMMSLLCQSDAKWFHCYVKVMPNDVIAMSKWCQMMSLLLSKWCQMMSLLCQSDAKWCHCYCQSDAKWCHCYCQSDAKWCHCYVKVMPNDVIATVKVMPNDVIATFKVMPNAVIAMSKWCQMMSLLLSKWCQMMSLLLSKWCQMMSLLCQSDAIM